MQGSAGLLWLLLLCLVCNSAEKLCKHDRFRPKTHGTKKFCDPSFSNQTAGAITQRCSSGFYREPAGPSRGRCVPCSCNGLSDECDEQTGDCVNCRSDASGPRCERCRDGYYGNSADRTCRACPCPSTWNNFAAACLDVGSGAVECLCKRGYSGARCDRCAFRYFGNPAEPGGSCKPCNCKNGLNICDSLTGECLTSGNSSCGFHCHDCDSCSVSLLADLEKMDDVFARLKQQLQDGSDALGARSRLSELQVNVSETEFVVGRFGAAVRRLNVKAEQLQADIDLSGNDLSQLIEKSLPAASDVRRILQKVNGTKLKAADLLSAAEALITATGDVLTGQSELQPTELLSLSEDDRAAMLQEAERRLQDRRGGCSAQRDAADTERQHAHRVLEAIRNDSSDPEEVLNAAADSLTASVVSVGAAAALLSGAEEQVLRAQDLNLQRHSALQHLEHLHIQLQTEQRTQLPVTETTKNLLKNTTTVFVMLEEIKTDFEKLAAQLDGANLQLLKRLNSIFMRKVDTVSRAEERAEQLNRHAAELQQVLLNATNSADLLSVLHEGALNNIINVAEKAEMAANQSREAANHNLKDVKERGLVRSAEGLKDNSARLPTDAGARQRELKELSHAVNTVKRRVDQQKEKAESVRAGLSAASDLRRIRRDDSDVLIKSAKTAAAASNSTVQIITDRLKNISQNMERITLNVSRSTGDVLADAERALQELNAALPVLKHRLTHVEALSGTAPPGANMTESIRRIKEVIEETRNFVNRVPLATTFNGKGHVELRPPRNLEDLKAFTAVDLLLDRHQTNERRRRRRRDRLRDSSSFLLYLGGRDGSGDFVGMAIRNHVLICVYMLGGVVHKVETSRITTTADENNTEFHRVVFHRVYQDAEVNITQSFTSQKPVRLAPKHNLPNTMSGVLQLDPGRVVLYVGGYPENFTPPAELRYPKYRGAMKLSYINDNPVCLFNYKRADKMNAKQPTVKIPQSEVSDYFEGTGYRMASVEKPDKIKRRLFKFHTNSRETDAVIFCIGNKESLFCLFLERGFLVLQGRQAGRELRAQSAETVSLHDKQFAVIVAERFIVHFGLQQISTDHSQTTYTSYYIGGLPAELRQRHNITAPPLRGCVDHLTEDAEAVKFSRTVGVSAGCPAALLGVRSAALSSALSADSPSVSLGFRSSDTHGALLSSSQGSSSARLSLADGYVVFNCDNYTLRSDRRYSDGSWHYLSAAKGPTGLQLSIDNVKMIQDRSLHHFRPEDPNVHGGKFTGCVSNLYTRRPERSFIPADLSSFPLTGRCRLRPPEPSRLRPPEPSRPQTHKPVKAAAGSQCEQRRAWRGEQQLSEEHSWLRYSVPQQDLNHRPHFSLDIKTKTSRGLILHVAGGGVVPLLALYVANGKIKMSLGRNRIIQHKQRSNDGHWHRVEFSVEKNTFHLLVDGIRVTDGLLPNAEGSSLDLHSPVYLGGDPTSRTTKGHNVPTNSVIGCFRDFKMNEVSVGEPEETHRTSPCTDWLPETGTHFGGGHIVFERYFSLSSQFLLELELRPQFLTGLLLHVQSHEASLSVFLLENKVVVSVKDALGVVSASATPPESLCDGKFHMVTVSKQRDVITLVLDSTSEQSAAAFTSTSATLETLYIGGGTERSRAPVLSPFVGCLRNVKLNGRHVEFETASRLEDPVSINRCPG